MTTYRVDKLLPGSAREPRPSKVKKHYGPGPHKNGTPQSIHGRKGPTKADPNAIVSFPASETDVRFYDSATVDPYIPAYEFWQQQADARARRSAVAAKLPQAEYDKRMKALKDYLAADTTKVLVRIDSTDFENALADGHLTNQHGTGTSNGLLAPGRRANAEHILFGNDTSDPSDKFPIYGLVHGDLGPDGVNTLNPDWVPGNWYGDVVLELDPSVKRNTTWMVGDSLDNSGVAAYWYNDTLDRIRGEDIKSGPSPMLDPSPASVANTDYLSRSFARNPAELEAAAHNSPYMEAEIHQEITPRDIKAIHIRTDGPLDPRELAREAETDVYVWSPMAMVGDERYARPERIFHYDPKTGFVHYVPKADIATGGQP